MKELYRDQDAGINLGSSYLICSSVGVVVERVLIGLTFFQKTTKDLSGDQAEDPKRFGFAVPLLDGPGFWKSGARHFFVDVV